MIKASIFKVEIILEIELVRISLALSKREIQSMDGLNKIEVYFTSTFLGKSGCRQCQGRHHVCTKWSRTTATPSSAIHQVWPFSSRSKMSVTAPVTTSSFQAEAEGQKERKGRKGHIPLFDNPNNTFNYTEQSKLRHT